MIGGCLLPSPTKLPRLPEKTPTTQQKGAQPGAPTTLPLSLSLARGGVDGKGSSQPPGWLRREEVIMNSRRALFPTRMCSVCTESYTGLDHFSLLSER